MKIFIIGASGFLGGTVYYKCKEKGFEVLGTYCGHRKNSEYVELDVFDTDRMTELIRDFHPDVVIWTVMNHELEEEIAGKVMTVLSKALGNTRFIFMSTSVAYEPDMTEEVKPYLRTADSYNHHYFNGKIKSEAVIRNIPNYCIIRPGSIYGIDPYGQMDYRGQILKEHVDAKKEFIRAANIVFSIVDVNELAEAVIELSLGDYVGIVNVSEEKPISHYDFNKALCRRYGWDDSCITPNEEEEKIYYLNNDKRKVLLGTKITSLQKKMH